ncbi:MAG: hypothetical protein IH621_16305 [Krumholzibacteria bacterium]|nr:hypothetical protein [Candidatus Krumholzibacteria bacterium]
MNEPRGQDRPSGRNPGLDGGPTLSARILRIVLLAALGLVVQGFAVPAGVAATVRTGTRAPADAPPVRAPAPPRAGGFSFDFGMADSAARDSLLLEIRRYSTMIGGLRDSLTAERGEIRLSPADRERLERSIGDISKVIENISAELGRMEFEVRDNTISLLDERGKGIVITIPENLDEHLSQGFHALSEIILSELPDTVRADGQRHLSWLGQRAPRPPRGARKVVQGNVVKIWDDLLVPWGEDVRGDVVVVFGNSEVQGRVDGNVVVVFGNLQLGDSAEVTGQVVTVGGRLVQDEGATAGDVFVLDPLGARRDLTARGLLGGGLRGFLVSQSLFVLMLVVALVAALAAPARRFEAVLAALQGAPAAAMGYGVLVALVGHLLVLVLIAVLVLTVIGIPVALLVWLALLVAGVIATTVAAAALGERVCRGKAGGCPSRWLAVLVGMLLLHLPCFVGASLGLMPGAGAAGAVVSVAGLVVKVCAYFFGVGALAMSRFGSARGPAMAPVAAASGEYSSA